MSYKHSFQPLPVQDINDQILLTSNKIDYDVVHSFWRTFEMIFFFIFEVFYTCFSSTASKRELIAAIIFSLSQYARKNERTDGYVLVTRVTKSFVLHMGQPEIALEDGSTLSIF